MRNIIMTVKQKNIEHRIVTINAETEQGEKISHEVHVTGNSIAAVIYGMSLMTQAIEEMHAKVQV